MNLKAILVFVLGTALITVSQYFYHPTLGLMIIAVAILLAVWGLVIWSGTRVGKGSSAIVKLALVAAVAAFMFSQGLDVAYSISGAPAGARFDLVPEVLIVAVGLLGLTLLIRLFALGSEEEEQTAGDSAD
jgi:hypothetical protein